MICFVTNRLERTTCSDIIIASASLPKRLARAKAPNRRMICVKKMHSFIGMSKILADRPICFQFLVFSWLNYSSCGHLELVGKRGGFKYGKRCFW